MTRERWPSAKDINILQRNEVLDEIRELRKEVKRGRISRRDYLAALPELVVSLGVLRAEATPVHVPKRLIKPSGVV